MGQTVSKPPNSPQPATSPKTSTHEPEKSAPMMTRVRFRTGWAHGALELHGNIGDVCEFDETMAHALIEAGTAEATDAPIGRVPIEMKSCLHCGEEVHFYLDRCWSCGGPMT